MVGGSVAIVRSRREGLGTGRWRPSAFSLLARPVVVAVANQVTSGVSVVVTVEVYIVVEGRDSDSETLVVAGVAFPCSVLASSGTKTPVRIHMQTTGMTMRATRANMLQSILVLRSQRFGRGSFGFSVAAMVVVLGRFLSPAAIFLTNSTVSIVVELPSEQRRTSRYVDLLLPSIFSICS